MCSDEVYEVTEFIWRRNPEGHSFASKKQFYDYLSSIKDTVYVGRDKENRIEGVALYQKYNNTINFISLTIREDVRGKASIKRGLKEILKKEKVKQVCWMNAKYNFRIFKV